MGIKALLPYAVPFCAEVHTRQSVKVGIKVLSFVPGKGLKQKVKFTVHAEGASRETLEKILKVAEERCPGAECLTQEIPLEVELKT